MQNRQIPIQVVCFCIAIAAAAPASAQRLRFSNTTAQPPATVPGTTGITPLTTPPMTTAPSPAPFVTGPPSTLQQPSFGNTGFDPYAPGAAAQPPTLYGSPAAPNYVAPGYGGPPPPGQIYGAYPQQPNSLFPNGMPVAPHSGQFGQPLRLFQNLRIRHTWLYGDGARKLDINDLDINTTMAFPNFLFSGQPLSVTPSFSLHLWAGPTAPKSGDLPSRAYSAYVDFGWTSNPLNALGTQLAGRFGVFSDFNTVTSNSLRGEGLALLTYRLSPSIQVKGGVVYLDRNRVKLLPAGGILWTPNPQTRFDIFFPQPKLAQFLTTVGTTDVWWYVGGEYGGGNWTVQRDSGVSDSVDINDIRVYFGFEWLRDQRRVAMFEVGYVTDREVIYRTIPTDSDRFGDTIMVRSEFSF